MSAVYATKVLCAPIMHASQVWRPIPPAPPARVFPTMPDAHSHRYASSEQRASRSDWYINRFIRKNLPQKFVQVRAEYHQCAIIITNYHHYLFISIMYPPQIIYLGFAQIILKLSPMCEGFSGICRHLLEFATFCRPELHEKNMY